MADQSIEAKAKALAGKKTEKGKEFLQALLVLNSLLEILNELRTNLAEARAADGMEAANNQNLMLAGTILASSSGGGAALVLQMSPATLLLLGKYGLGQPRKQLSTSRSVLVTKLLVTIHNNTTNTTTNNVSVPTGGGPTLGRPILFKLVDNGTDKFKVWMNNAFARQNELAKKRLDEYNHREWSLTRSANKMMRKLEEVGKSLGEAINPEKIGASVGSLFKTLLFLLLGGFLAKNWAKILTVVDGIEGITRGILSGFGFDVERTEKTKFEKSLCRWFGCTKKQIDDPNFGIIDAFKLLFIGEKDEHGKTKREGIFGLLLSLLDLWFGHRMKFVKAVKWPEFKPQETNINIPGMGWLNDAIGGISRTFMGITKNLGTYLSDCFSAFFGGEEGARNSISQQMSRESASALTAQSIYDKELYHRKIDDETSSGDAGMYAKGGKTQLRVGDVDNRGNLVEGPAASIRQGQVLNKILSGDLVDQNGLADVTGLMTGFLRLQNAAERDGQVVVDKSLFDNLGTLVGSEIADSIKRTYANEITLKKFKYVRDENGGFGSETSDFNAQVGGAESKAWWDIVVPGWTGYLWLRDAAKGTYTLLTAPDKDERKYALKLVPSDDPRPAVRGTGDPDELPDGTVLKHVLSQDLLGEMYSLLASGMGMGEGFNFDASSQEQLLNFSDFITLKAQLRVAQSGRTVRDAEGRRISAEEIQGNASKSIISHQLITKTKEEKERKEKEQKERLHNSVPYAAGREIGNSIVETYNETLRPYVDPIIDAVGNVTGVGVGSVGTGDTKKNAEFAFKYLVSRGVPEVAAAGMVGNFICENIKNPTLTVNDSRGTTAYGIACMNSKGDLPNFMKWREKEGRDGSFLSLLDYFVENRIPTVKGLNSIYNAQSTRDASFIWGKYYERFAGRGLKERGIPSDGKGYADINDDEHVHRAQKAEAVLREFGGSVTPGDFSWMEGFGELVADVSLVNTNDVQAARVAPKKTTVLYTAPVVSNYYTSNTSAETLTAGSIILSNKYSIGSGRESSIGILIYPGASGSSAGSATVQTFTSNGNRTSLTTDGSVVGNDYLVKINPSVIALIGASWVAGSMSVYWKHGPSFGKAGKTVKWLAENEEYGPACAKSGAGRIVLYAGLNSYLASNEKIVAGYKLMAQVLKTYGAHVYFCSMIAVAEPDVNALVPRINSCMKLACLEAGVDYIDLYPLSGKYMNFYGTTNRDAKFHLKREGYKMLAEDIEVALGLRSAPSTVEVSPEESSMQVQGPAVLATEGSDGGVVVTKADNWRDYETYADYLAAQTQRELIAAGERPLIVPQNELERLWQETADKAAAKDPDGKPMSQMKVELLKRENSIKEADEVRQKALAENDELHKEKLQEYRMDLSDLLARWKANRLVYSSAWGGFGPGRGTQNKEWNELTNKQRKDFVQWLIDDSGWADRYTAGNGSKYKGKTVYVDDDGVVYASGTHKKKVKRGASWSLSWTEEDETDAEHELSSYESKKKSILSEYDRSVGNANEAFLAFNESFVDGINVADTSYQAYLDTEKQKFIDARKRARQFLASKYHQGKELWKNPELKERIALFAGRAEDDDEAWEKAKLTGWTSPITEGTNVSDYKYDEVHHNAMITDELSWGNEVAERTKLSPLQLKLIYEQAKIDDALFELLDPSKKKEVIEKATIEVQLKQKAENERKYLDNLVELGRKGQASTAQLLTEQLEQSRRMESNIDYETKLMYAVATGINLLVEAQGGEAEPLPDRDSVPALEVETK